MTDPNHSGQQAMDQEIAAAHAIYTPRNLKLYDLVVHGLSNRFAWLCPTKKLDRLYEENLSGNHLEAGVGTGFFLQRAGRPQFDRLTLLDINESCLAEASSRLSRYAPDLLQASLFEPVPVSGPFDSIGLTYILHCLPGTMTEKLRVVDNLAPAMDAGTVLFGATILGKGIAANAPARALLSTYNRNGVFHNRDDDFASLQAGLQARFRKVDVWQEGCVALFRTQGYSR